METAHITTPLGTAILQGNEQGIASITVIAASEKTPDTVHIPACLQTAVQQLQEYFEGKRTIFELALNPTGTEFQKKVWNTLCTIPYGKTVSYLDMAKSLGDPKVIRAAATANGKNPLWIVVPCHRVIGSDGSLTGYAGGLWRKKWLLAHEQPVKQQSLF